jgi:pyridoxamine 5'-phosphate oxidase
MPNRDVHNMRESYESSFLLEEDCDANPFHQFDKWFHHAVESKLPEPNAMTLATVGKDGQPSARIVLLKSFSKHGFIFYTNYESRKGKQMQENDKVSLLFWWQERQVRIEGVVNKVDRAAAATYFHSRPKGSQIGALVSPQSQVLENRNILEERFKELEHAYKGKEVPLPENWGGYIVIPHLMEFWQGRMSRLHDRIQYTKLSEEKWKIERLAP